MHKRIVLTVRRILQQVVVEIQEFTYFIHVVYILTYKTYDIEAN